MKTAKTYPTPDVAERLRKAGLKPTRQRLALGALLFAGPHRHVTTEVLFEEARATGTDVSLATVYNTLNQFCDAGLLRGINLDSDRRWFDTDVGAHRHFFFEDTGDLTDIPDERLEVASLPSPPDGYEVDVVDVVVRLKRQPPASEATQRSDTVSSCSSAGAADPASCPDGDASPPAPRVACGDTERSKQPTSGGNHGRR